MSLGESKNLALRFIHQLIRRNPLVHGIVDQPGSRSHEQSFDGRIFNNFAVMLDVGRGRHLVNQIG